MSNQRIFWKIASTFSLESSDSTCFLRRNEAAFSDCCGWGEEWKSAAAPLYEAFDNTLFLKAREVVELNTDNIVQILDSLSVFFCSKMPPPWSMVEQTTKGSEPQKGAPPSDFEKGGERPSSRIFIGAINVAMLQSKFSLVALLKLAS